MKTVMVLLSLFHLTLLEDALQVLENTVFHSTCLLALLHLIISRRIVCVTTSCLMIHGDAALCPAVIYQFALWDAMIVQIPPPHSPCPSPAMSPYAPSSSPTSLTPPVATSACARGTCMPAQGRAPRQRHGRNPQQSLEMGLKLGLTLGLDKAKGCF